jgi:hypothetical protein
MQEACAVARARVRVLESVRVKSCFLMLVLFALGCSNDPGALYTSGKAAKDSGADKETDAAKREPLPDLPALPDEDHIPDCTRCAADKCKTARANCLEDDYCTDELRCKGTCDNIACLHGCSADFGWSPWYGDYANCVFGQCQTECNSGHNWQCEGKYDWPAAEQSSFAVRFRFTAPPTYFLGSQSATNVVGATVRACADNADCEGSEQDSDTVGIDNTVQLDLDATTFQPKDFRGYLEIDSGDGGEHERLYAAPLSRPQDYFAGYVSTGIGPVGYDHALARIDVIAVDCLVAPVAGVKVTLPDFPDVDAYSLDNQLTFPKGPTTETGLAFLVNLPKEASQNRVRVHVQWPNERQQDSERAIWVRPGYGTTLSFAPLTASDLARSR